MITNYDEETEPLTDVEKEAATVIAKTMDKFHKGAENAVTGSRIGKGMAENANFVLNGKPYLTGARVRKIMNYLRTECKKLIISSNKGYWTSEDPQEIRDCIRSLRERASAINNVADCMEDTFKKKFAGNPAAMMAI